MKDRMIAGGFMFAALAIFGAVLWVAGPMFLVGAAVGWFARAAR